MIEDFRSEIYYIEGNGWRTLLSPLITLSKFTVFFRQMAFSLKFDWCLKEKSIIFGTRRSLLASYQSSSVTQSCLTLRPHELQHARLLCPSPTPRTCSNSCSSSWWCHPTISSSVIPFSSRLQSVPASGSFPSIRSQFFASGGQSIGVSASASVLPMNIPGWFPLGLTSLISLQSKGLSRVFSKTTV